MTQDLFKCTECNSFDLVLDLATDKDGIVNLVPDNYKIRLGCRNCLFYVNLNVPKEEDLN